MGDDHISATLPFGGWGLVYRYTRWQEPLLRPVEAGTARRLPQLEVVALRFGGEPISA